MRNKTTWIIIVATAALITVKLYSSASIDKQILPQPINFSHNKHLNYFRQGVHRYFYFDLHEQALGEIPVELKGGECAACHGDYEEAIVDFPKMKPCAGCHKLFGAKVVREEPSIKPCVGCHRQVLGYYAASIPNVGVCVSCHKQPRTDINEEAKLRRYINQKDNIAWKRVYDYLAGDIVFSHKSHVKWGKIGCAECHGNIEEATMPLKFKVKLSMDDCVACHEKRNANNDCMACHK